MAATQIQAPDGSLVEFPEGTSDDTILKVMRQNYPATPSAPAPQAAPPAASSTVGDIVQSAGSGLIRGAAGLLDTPQAIYGLLDQAAAAAAHQTARGISALTGMRAPNSDRGIDTTPHGLLPNVSDWPKVGEKAVHALEAATGPLYQPQTVAGQYAGTVAGFLPGAGKSAAELAAYGALPAVASETAGQVTKGTAAEPWARFVGALGGSAGGRAVSGPAYHERMAAHASHGASPQQLEEAARLAEASPFPVMASEAIQAASGGATQLGRVQRLAESLEGGAKVLDPIMAQRPGQMQQAAGSAFDLLGPRASHPAELGRQVQEAARGAVMGSPEGRELAQAIEAAGPRTTAGMAGAVIQPDLRGVRNEREAARQVEADRDYAAARGAPERFGVERMIDVERPGDPVVTQQQYSRPQFDESAPAPLTPPNRGAAPADPAGPESLARYVARNGGIRLDGDAAATDLHRFNIPGLGPVARPTGKGIDNFWREELIAKGYLPPDADGGAARDISSTLLRKLQNEQRGYPSYPIGAERAPAGPRASQQADEYANAVDLARSRMADDFKAGGIRPEDVHPEIKDRVLGALVRGEHDNALDALERTVGAMRANPEPLSKSTTVTEQIPDVRFGQVNPQGALDALDGQLANAKGDVRGALGGMRRDLYESTFNPETGRHEPRVDPATGHPALDMSVEGLLNARYRWDQKIAQAVKDSDGPLVKDLTITRGALDAGLKQVPEVAHADANFARNSIPLEPFERPNAPLGTATARVNPRDPASPLSMPPEQVPPMLATPSGTREFYGIAGPQAQGAMDRFLATRALDQAHGNYHVDAEKLRAGMRDSADLMDAAPTVRDRLSNILAAREGLAPVEATPVGRMGEVASVREQLARLLGKGTSPVEAAETVRALSGQNSAATRGLVREGAGELANRTVNAPDSHGRPDQYGGAKLARDYRGPDGSRLRAAIEAALGGPGSERIKRLMDSLAATGWRDPKGSLTASNLEDIKNLRQGGMVGQAARFGTKPMGATHEAVEKFLLGRSSEQLARLLASGPVGVRRIQELRNDNSRAALIAALAASRSEPQPALARR